MTSDCFFCNSLDKQNIRDYYNAFDFSFCNSCSSWETLSNNKILYKYKKINGKTYILEEEGSCVHVYNCLIENVDEFSQPDMLVEIPEILYLENTTINKFFNKLEMHLNFK